MQTFSTVVTIIGIIVGLLTINYAMNKIIKNVNIKQSAEEMSHVTGAELNLIYGEDVLLKNLTVDQEAERMNNVTGLKIDVEGDQSARLQGVNIKQPNAEITISGDPNVRVEINN